MRHGPRAQHAGAAASAAGKPARPARAVSGRCARGLATTGLLALLAVLGSAAPAFAQKATLQITQGPYYSGVPIDLQIVADDFDEDPQPEVRADAPPGTSLAFVQSRPQVSSMMQIVNGRVSQSRTVRFAYVYQLTAERAGSFQVGPFTVTQGGKTATTGSMTLKVGNVPQAAGQRLRVRLPDHAVYVGQRVPVTVEWWTEAGLADKLYNERLRVPLFLDTTNFQFLDAEHEPSRIVVNVEVPGGTTEFPVDVRQVREGGTNWVVRSFSRTLVPVATGRFDLGDSTLVCEQAIAFQRDIFGSRVPSRTRRVQVAGEPMVLDVQAVPSDGRPASFAGAIGQGFTMDVAADRTVLRAGDPVKLTITIRGDGSLDAASLPPLAAAGLSPSQFRLPEGDVAGITDGSGKRFDVNVRVLDPAVREIPPIEYSWFDPSSGRFETTHSNPIALSVRAATVVGAGDVVSAEPPPAPTDTTGGGAEPPPRAAATNAPAFTLTGADLAIETDLGRLQSSSASWLGSRSVVLGGYAGGILSLACGLLVRRRRRIDPVQAALRKELRALRGRIAAARSSKDVADALRKMGARRGDFAHRDDGLDQVLAALDEAVYAPGGAEAAPPDALRSRAIEVADAIVEDAR